MLDLLASVAVLTAAVAAGLGALALLTLAPFVLALRLAERRGVDPARAGALTLVLSVLGVGLLLVLRSAGPAALGALPLAFAGPVLVALLPAGGAVGGRVGRHQ